MLAAMDIYCELLGSPGVLKAEDTHLLDELRLLRDSSGKLLDRLLIDALKCLSTDQARSAEHSQSRDQAPLRASARGDGSQYATVQPVPPVFPILYDPSDLSENAYPESRALALPDLPAAETGKHVTDLATELRSSLPMLAALAGPRVHVSLELAGCPQGELFIPPIDLTRVLINLVRNAAEAMSIGGRVVIAATATVYKASTAVLISIEDNGPGIPLSLLDRIFDLQVANRSTEESSRPRMQFRPRGLGLRIVREFIEASGGTVRALRLPDRGSRFEVMLPMVTLMVTKGGATL
jgi:signal transduction histidine kinase